MLGYKTYLMENALAALQGEAMSTKVSLTERFERTTRTQILYFLRLKQMSHSEKFRFITLI